MANTFKSSRGAYGVDLNMIEQINAFQDTDALQSNLNTIRKQMNQFYEGQAADFANMSTKMGEGFSKNFGESASSGISKFDWAGLGEKIGGKLSDAIFSTFKKALNSWMTNTYGTVDIAGSFGKGTSLFAQMRSELGGYTYGQNALKDFGKAIETAYKNLSEQGIAVSPSLIYSMYNKLGDLVSISGSSGSRIASLLNTVTRIEQGAGQLDVTSDYVERLIGSMGEEFSSQIILAQNQQMAYLASQNDKVTNEFQQYVLNNTRMYDSLLVTAKQMGLSDKETSDYIIKNSEDISQAFAYLAQNSSSVSAKEIAKLVNATVETSETDWAQLFSNEGGLGTLLTQTEAGRNLDYSTPGGLKRNIPQLILAVTEALQSNLLTDEYAAQMAKTLGIDIDWANLAMIRSGTINSRDFSRYVNENISTEQLSSVDEAISEKSSFADRKFNYGAELLGLQASDATYQSQALSWLTVIGNKVTELVDTDLLKSVISGGTSGLVSKLIPALMKGGGGAKGLLSLLGAASPWVLGIGAVAGSAALIYKNLKNQSETTDKNYREAYDQWKQTSDSVWEIKENGVIARKEKGIGDTQDNVIVSNADGTYSSYSKTDPRLEEEKRKAIEAQKSSANKAMSDYFTRGLGVASGNLFADSGYGNIGETANIGEGSGITLSAVMETSPEGVRHQSYEDGKGLKFTLSLPEGGSRDVYLPKSLGSYSGMRFLGDMDAESLKALLNEPSFIESYVTTSQEGNNWLDNLRFLKAIQSVPGFNDLLSLYEIYGVLDYKSGWNDVVKSFYDNFNKHAESHKQGRIKFNNYNGLIQTLYETNQIKAGYVDIPALEQLKGDEIKLINNSPIGDLLEDGFELNLNKNSHATGTDAVPYDGYPAILHAGEMVIPAKRANFIRALLGQKLVTPSTYSANRKTGDNDFVQSIPEYASGTDNPANSALKFAISQIGVPYGTQDCSDLVSNAYRKGRAGVPGAGLNVPDSTAAGIGQNWPKYGFSVIYSSPDSPYRNQKISKTEAAGFGLRPGDIILYDLDTDRTKDRYMQISHTAMIYNDGVRQIHSTPKQGGTAISGLWNGIVKILRYGAGGSGNIPTFNSSTSSASAPKSIPDSMRPLLQSKNPMVISMLRRLGYINSDGDISSSSNVDANATIGDWASLNSSFALSPYSVFLSQAAAEFGIPTPLLLYGLMLRESGGNPESNRYKSTQYKGLMQVNMDAIRSVGGTDPYDPLTNIRAGAKHLYEAYKHKNIGYWTLATLAYNTGPGLKAYEGVHNEIAQNGFPGWDWITSYVKANSSKYPRFNAAAYGGRIYDMAGITPQQYLAEGGIVKSTPGGVPTVIGEGKYDEAVIPLNDNKDYLKIEEVGADIIDVLDAISTRICNKLDILIDLKQRQMKEDNMVLSTAQRSARTEALLNFRGVY